MNHQKALRKLGQIIRDRRKDLQISSVATAEAAEVSRVTLHRIERGEASVSVGAYMSVIMALGLEIELQNPDKLKTRKQIPKLPRKIRIGKYRQLKKLAWQLKGTKELSPQEALELYERNWRHVDIKKLDLDEKEFIDNLLAAFGRERLLV